MLTPEEKASLKINLVKPIEPEDTENDKETVIPIRQPATVKAIKDKPSSIAKGRRDASPNRVIISRGK